MADSVVFSYLIRISGLEGLLYSVRAPRDRNPKHDLFVLFFLGVVCQVQGNSVELCAEI